MIPTPLSHNPLDSALVAGDLGVLLEDVLQLVAIDIIDNDLWSAILKEFHDVGIPSFIILYHEKLILAGFGKVDRQSGCAFHRGYIHRLCASGLEKFSAAKLIGDCVADRIDVLCVHNALWFCEH